LPPERERGLGKTRNPVATDQTPKLRILKEVLQRLIHRIERGGFVQQQKINGLQAELTEAGLQAEHAVTSGEIPAHHAATVETANQRA
jgi:hypothetical protein